MAMRMRMRRELQDVSLSVDLTSRLAAYRCDAGIHCHGCGAWVGEDGGQVPHWGYDQRGGGSGQYGPYAYCDRCARLGLVAR
jgi:hypothetical protein